MPKNIIPPPAPPFPLFTLDGLAGLFLRPITNPFLPLLPPLVAISLDPHPHSNSFYFASIFAITSFLFQILSYVNKVVAGGRKRRLDWTQEVVLITGGAGGLGRALAEYYGSIRRCSTAVVDVLPASSERCDEWEEVGCLYYQCDVGDFEAVKALRQKVESDLGHVSIVILAAGIVTSKSIFDLGAEDIDRSIHINFLGAVWSIKAFLPAMLGRKTVSTSSTEDSTDPDESATPGGTIVTISSVLSQLGAAGLSDYTASKAALSTFHNSLKAELALSPSTPRINLILASPGQLATPLFAHVPPPLLASFLGPTVTPALLAAEIIRAVDEGRDAEIRLPLYAEWIGVLSVLPAGLTKALRWCVGLDRAGWEGVRANKEGRMHCRRRV